MTGTLDRLTDAMTAAGDTVQDATLRPLIRRERDRRLPRWVAPVAAAAAVALVIGSAAALSGRQSGPGRPAVSSVIAPHRYYVESGLFDVTVVRSTATGAVTATLPIPYRDADPPVVAAGPDGAFYVAAFVRGASGERIYRFRLTSTGHVSGFSPLPGGLLGAGQMADSMAASPSGSLLAFGLAHTFGNNPPPDQLVVINTVTGAKTTWRGGVARPGFKWLKIASLSWTGDGKKLVVLGQWTRMDSGFYSETGSAGRIAEVREIDLASGGGRVSGGRLLLRQSALFPYIAQALISPDGSTITALVLKGGIVGSKQLGGIYPENMSVEQISAATGRKLSVLYRRSLGDTGEINGAPAPLLLSNDASGQHLMLNVGLCVGRCTDGFNGWIHDGRLIPLQPADGRLASEAW
jgi:hypothetical protein